MSKAVLSIVRSRALALCSLALLATATVAPGCTASRGTVATPPAAELAAALENYRLLAVRSDAHAMAGEFTEQGSLAHKGQPPVVGRAAIERFLASFAAYRVVSEELIADTTTATGASGVQTGRYRQTVETPADGTVTVNGTFRADWQREPDGRWRLARLETASP